MKESGSGDQVVLNLKVENRHVLTLLIFFTHCAQTEPPGFAVSLTVASPGYVGEHPLT